MTIEEQLALHEGRRRFPYVDTVGKLTIGIGRNLTDKGLSDAEIDVLLINDLTDCRADLETFPWWAGLDDVRRNALLDMRFNLGPARFRGFTATLAAVARGDYGKAADQMLKSKWATQVKGRATRLARMMATGLALVLLWAAPLFAQVETLQIGEPFTLAADHDGLRTTVYQIEVVIPGATVPIVSETRPLSDLANGTIRFVFPTGFPAVAPLGSYQVQITAVGTHGTSRSPILQIVLVAASGSPADPLNIRLSRP